MLDLRQVAFNIEQGPRENIEDAVGSIAGTILSPEIFNYKAFVLCDGVGGNIGGEVASEEAVRRVLAYLSTFLPLWQTGSPIDYLQSQHIVGIGLYPLLPICCLLLTNSGNILPGRAWNG